MSGRHLVLGIETTGSHLGLSLLRMADGRRVAAFFEERPARQSDLLFPTLDRLLAKAGTTKAALSLIGVNNGPGSFTGVRVGVAAARSIAQGLAIPCAASPGLEAVARETFLAKPEASAVAVALPALANEFYFALFARSAAGVRRVVAPTWRPVSAFAPLIAHAPKKGRLVVAGRRLADLAAFGRAGIEWLEGSGVPHPDTVARMALERFRRSPGSCVLEKVEPDYLQPSWAERTAVGGPR